MSKITTTSALPLAPREYSTDYMNRLVRQISIEINKMRAVGPISCGSDLTNQSGNPVSGLTIVNVPTSPDGLAKGMVWSDGGTLKIVS